MNELFSCGSMGAYALLGPFLLDIFRKDGMDTISTFCFMGDLL